VAVVGLAGRERAQLLLAGAFVLAVALIGLTIVLTSSSYTTTLANQENGVVRGSDAVTVRKSLDHELTRQFEFVFRNYSAGNRRTPFETVVAQTGNETTTHYARRGRLVNVTMDASGAGFIEGARIKQSEDLNLDSPSNVPNWVVAEDVEVRNATLIIGDISDAIPTSSPSTATRMFFETPGAGGDWSLAFMEQSKDIDGDGSLETVWNISSISPSGKLRSCVREEVNSNYEAKLDLDAGTLNGDRCGALLALSPEGNRYDVRIVRGARTTAARYWLIVDKQPGSLGTLFAGPFTDAEPVLYGARVRYRYHSATVTYETNVDIAPQELS